MRKTLLALLFVLANVAAMAIPARPGQYKMITLADGTQIRVEVRGDERCHYLLAEDGRMFTENDGGYTQITTADVEQQTLARQRVNRVQLGMPHEPYIGTKRCLCILVNFNDKKFEDGHVEKIKELINKVGYEDAALGHRGSVRDYFLAQSNGVFDVNFDVVGPFELPYNCKYYGGNDAYGNDKKPDAMVKNAIMQANDLVDFKDYDWDDDGECESIYIVYAGKGEADGGDADCVWPHNGELKGVRYDGVQIVNYACGGELDGQKGCIAGIGTMCHEYSHCLGLPDFYDTKYTGNYGTSYWDIMNVGSYNDESRTPAAYNAYERWFAGWLEPVELTETCSIEGMQPLNEGGAAYVVYNDAHRDEYYLLENRARTGWDSGLPGEGLLVTHVDFNPTAWLLNEVNCKEQQLFSIIAADGSYGTAKGDVGQDAYPTYRNNSLTNTSTPAAVLYHPNSLGNNVMDKPITDIVRNAADATISFRFEDNCADGDGIRENVCASVAPVIYNLAGQRVLPRAKGIAVMNGKKVLR